MRAGEHQRRTSGVSIESNLYLHFSAFFLCNRSTFFYRYNSNNILLSPNYVVAAMRSTSWRGGENEPGPNSDVANMPPRLERSKSSHGNMLGRDGQMDGPNPNRRFGGHAAWDDDNLPEWAMDDPIDGGGSFDATGAFMGPADRHKLRTGIDDSLDRRPNRTRPQQNDRDSDENNPSNDPPLSVPGSADTDDDARENTEQRPESTDIMGESANAIEPVISGKEHAHAPSNHSIEPIRSKSEELPKELEASSIPEKVVTSFKSEKFDANAILPADRMQEVAEDIEKLIMEDDQSANDPVDALIGTHLHHDAHKIAGTSDAHLIDKPKEKDVTDLWYYRDPQGKVQGPFTATEMLEWYRAGYFDDTLNVRRVCDRNFLELGELLKLCGGALPFVGMSHMPPMLQPTSATSDISASAPVQATAAAKPANNLVHNNKLPPQSTTNPNYYDMLQSQSFMPLDYGKKCVHMLRYFCFVRVCVLIVSFFLFSMLLTRCLFSYQQTNAFKEPTTNTISAAFAKSTQKRFQLTR